MKNYPGGNFTWYECEAHPYMKVPLALTFAVGIHPNHYGEPAEYTTEYKTAQWADQLFEDNELYPQHAC